MKKTIAILIFFISSYSSANNIVVPFEKNIQIKKNGEVYNQHDYGSGVRWNQDYIVSAKHVNFVQNSVYQCSKNCDLQFIKKNANNFIVPKWRDVKPHEFINIMGNSSNGKIVNAKGTVFQKDFYMNNDKVLNDLRNKNQKNSLLYATTAKIVHGQSGGPVIGVDGSVVGILIGETEVTNANGDKLMVSMFVPYSVIKQEWDKFQG